MKTISARLCNERIERQQAAGRFNPATVAIFTYKRARYVAVLPCGSSDDIEIFRDGDTLYVVCVNRRLGYAGLTTYGLSDRREDLYNPRRFCAVETGEIFSQSTEELEDLIGKNWDDLTLRTLAKRFANLLY